MQSGNPKLGALRIVDRAAWAKIVLRAIRENSTREDAAKELGITRNTLLRWANDLGVPHVRTKMIRKR